MSDYHGKKIQETSLLDRSWEGKNTILVTFDLTKTSEKEMDYQPGDHLAIFPQNPEAQVSVVYDRFDQQTG